MVPYSRTLLSPLKPRTIQPPFNPKIEKIRGFNGLAPLNPAKPQRKIPFCPPDLRRQHSHQTLKKVWWLWQVGFIFFRHSYYNNSNFFTLLAQRRDPFPPMASPKEEGGDILKLTREGA